MSTQAQNISNVRVSHILLVKLPGGMSTVATAPFSPCIWTLSKTVTTFAGFWSLFCRSV